MYFFLHECVREKKDLAGVFLHGVEKRDVMYSKKVMLRMTH